VSGTETEGSFVRSFVSCFALSYIYIYISLFNMSGWVMSGCPERTRDGGDFSVLGGLVVMGREWIDFVVFFFWEECVCVRI
jgi:hypothetical protein